MYRPVTISAFAALVAVCDMCYWRQVENMPEGVRVAMGKFDHPVKAPLEENMVVTVPCAAVLAGFYFLWLGAATTFLPLALPYAPVIIVMAGVLPVIFQYGLSWVFRHFEKFFDNFTKHAPVSIPGGLTVKAILAQLVCTVIMLATTGSFYTNGQRYFESAKTVRTLLDGFRMDVSFNFQYAFSWPTSLPSVSKIHFSIALGVVSK